MSRFVGHPVHVEADTETGEPLRVDGAPVVSILDHWREWIGILQGEPERDLWRVHLSRGICELHRITFDHCDQWLLARWED